MVQGEPSGIDENLRAICLVLIDVAANQMAIRKLLYDSGVSDEKKFQEAYAWAGQAYLDVFRQALETDDAARLRAILEAMRETPRKI